MQDYENRMKHAEKLVCQTYPVYDSRYRSDPDSPFHLYDCLAPALKQHIPVPEILLPKSYLVDIGMQMKYHREKLAIEKLDFSNVLAENKELRARVEAQEKELETVDWHIEFRMDKRSPKQILEAMHKAEADKQDLQKELDQLKAKYTAMETTLNGKVKVVMKKLKDCNNKVINPLKNEMKISTEIQIRAKADLDKNIKDLKAMGAVLRLPAMTAEF